MINYPIIQQNIFVWWASLTPEQKEQQLDAEKVIDCLVHNEAVPNYIEQFDPVSQKARKLQALRIYLEQFNNLQTNGNLQICRFISTDLCSGSEFLEPNSYAVIVKTMTNRIVEQWNTLAARTSS